MKFRYFRQPWGKQGPMTLFPANAVAARGFYALTGRAHLLRQDLDALVQLGFEPVEVQPPKVVDSGEEITPSQLRVITALVMEMGGDWEKIDELCLRKFGQRIAKIKQRQASSVINVLLKKMGGNKK